VWLLLPASRNFHPTAARPHDLFRVLRDPALLALYGIAATAVGAFVAVYNGAVFRLSGSPYELSAGAAGLVFCVYLLGSAGSATAGTLADRYGRRKVVPVGCLITLAGVAITLAAPLPLIILGLYWIVAPRKVRPPLLRMGLAGCAAAALAYAEMATMMPAAGSRRSIDCPSRSLRL